jgi:hypothetical protein
LNYEQHERKTSLYNVRVQEWEELVGLIDGWRGRGAIDRERELVGICNINAAQSNLSDLIHWVCAYTRRVSSFNGEDIGNT